jgi:thiamine biosynthesis lipoprotein
VRISILLAGFASSLVAASPGWHPAGAPRDLLRVEKIDEAMGATFSVVIYGEGRTKLEAAADAALAEARRLDLMLSNYTPASEWSGLNRDAGFRPVKVSAELFELLSACIEYSKQTDGAFDITVGPLMKVWGFYKGEGLLPRPAEVTGALSRVGYRNVRLDPEARTVAFTGPGVELDPGGIGKGYAVDRMVDLLERRGVAMALVSASGSSIYGIGAPPGEPEGWRIPVRAPGDPRKTAAEVRLKNMSLSTSGSYEKFFRAEGRTFSHIVDPRTGHPAQGASSVSVLAARTIDSEAWTKPYFINGREWTAAHKPTNHRVLFCDDASPNVCSWI